MQKNNKFSIYYLRKIWNYYTNVKHSNQNVQKIEWKYINGVFNTLGIGIEPTIQYLISSSPSFSEFENWIEQNGRFSKDVISYFNSIILKDGDENFILDEKVFDESDLEKWDKDGYVILKDAISKEDCLETVRYISSKIEVNLDEKKSWYKDHDLKQGIMIQLFNSTILDKNRLAKRVRLAFEQLWKKNNLMVSMDRVSFNPPECETYNFQGPNLHWDVSLKKPIPFGIQGLLYLNDVDENQGAFTVIPGFHNIINTWLDTIKENPREINLLDIFDEKPIAGNAGDLILWNQCLPHGSRPNHSNFPRFVQYINYQPIDLEYQEEYV